MKLDWNMMCRKGFKEVGKSSKAFGEVDSVPHAVCSLSLSFLNGPKLTFSEEHEDFPTVLTPSDLLTYKELLTI